MKKLFVLFFNMKNPMINIIYAFAFIFCFSNCDTGEVDINNTADFESFIQEEMETEHIPALSVLIFKEGEILYESNLGDSQIEQGIKLESDHLFLLASVSKVVTATALLQLAEDELFDLDEPINDYLPFEVKIPDYTTEISFRMLLTHTSGIADGSALDDQYYYGQDSPVTLAYFIENYLVPTGEFYAADENFHDFEPGTRHEYSNIGSALIGVLVEEISGMGFNEYCKQHIFNPLGMSHTAWRLDEITQIIVQPYNYKSGDYEAIEHYTNADYPNGGLRSTARDLHTLFSVFIQEGKANNHQLLEAATVSDVLSLQIPSIDNEMGLHMFVMDADNDLWGHDGGEQGVATIAAFNQETKVGAIILANQGDANLDEILLEAYGLGLKL